MTDRDIDRNLGVSRRQVLKRGAIAGGALVWATPVVQSFGGRAFAQDAENGTPRCDADASADAIDVASSSTGTDGGSVSFLLRFATSCEPCPAGDTTFQWACRDTVNFTCNESQDSSTWTDGGTLGSGGDGAVTVEARVTVMCEDGDSATDCRAERFIYEDGFVSEGGDQGACTAI